MKRGFDMDSFEIGDRVRWAHAVFQPEKQDAEGNATRKHNIGRIALLEDDRDTAELMRLILGDEHHIAWFSTAGDFLEVFQTDAFDLILLDISLPDASGLELYASIRDRSKAIPVIVISGHAELEAIQEAKRRGVSDYITKPIVDLDALCETVRCKLRQCL
jgi:DNA-binding NtrC family response regulator